MNLKHVAFILLAIMGLCLPFSASADEESPELTTDKALALTAELANFDGDCRFLATGIIPGVAPFYVLSQEVRVVEGEVFVKRKIQFEGSQGDPWVRTSSFQLSHIDPVLKFHKRGDRITGILLKTRGDKPLISRSDRKNVNRMVIFSCPAEKAPLLKRALWSLIRKSLEVRGE